MRAQIGIISASYAPQPFQVLMDRIIKISLSKHLLHKVFERIECGVQKIGFVDLLFCKYHREKYLLVSKVDITEALDRVNLEV